MPRYPTLLTSFLAFIGTLALSSPVHATGVEPEVVAYAIALFGIGAVLPGLVVGYLTQRLLSDWRGLATLVVFLALCAVGEVVSWSYGWDGRGKGVFLLLSIVLGSLPFWVSARLGRRLATAPLKKQ